MPLKHRNALGPSTFIECGGCNEEYFYAHVLVDAPLESTTITITIIQVCHMLVVV
jgi:hypothetical protein